MKNDFNKGRVSVHDAPTIFDTSGALKVEVVNQSDSDWKSEGTNPVNLSYHWLGEYENMVVFDGIRTPLPLGGIPAGASATVLAKVDRPEIPGDYELVITLVREGIQWFDEAKDFHVARVSLRVTQFATRASLGPKMLGSDGMGLTPYDKNRNFGFMHIPKTAGAAMRSFLHKALHPVVFEVDCAGVGVYVHWLDSKFLGKTNYAGHLAYTNLSKYCPHGQFLTVLREPSSRIVSHWLFWRTFATPPSKGTSGPEIANPLSVDVISLTGGLNNRCASEKKPIMRSVEKLVDVLMDPLLANHIDNVSLRMLVWPHPRLPDDGFIDQKNDEELLQLAFERLKIFSYLDVIENPRYESNLRDWLHVDIPYGRENVTAPTPQSLRVPLFRELTAEALEALEQRSRLDRVLWKAVAEARLPGVDIDRLQRATLMKNMARHAAIMSPSGTGELAGWLSNLPALMRVNMLYSILQRFLKR